MNFFLQNFAEVSDTYVHTFIPQKNRQKNDTVPTTCDDTSIIRLLTFRVLKRVNTCFQ